MSETMPIELLIESINNVYNISLDPNDYSGYLIKFDIKKTDCSNYSIKDEKTKQYHIAITNVKNGMNLFPLTTDFEYLLGNPEQKRGFTNQIGINLNKQNLVDKVNNIIDNYEKIEDSLLSTQKLKLSKEEYNNLKSELESKESNIKTYSTMVYSRRNNPNSRELSEEEVEQMEDKDLEQQPKQRQLEIGTTSDPMDFLNFRRLMLIGDTLIIIKKREKYEYLFLVFDSETAQNCGFDTIDSFYKDSKDKTIISIEKACEGFDEQVKGENIKGKYYIHEIKPELIDDERITLETNIDDGQLSINDTIFLYALLDNSKFMVGMGNVLEVNTNEKTQILTLEVTKYPEHVLIDQLIEEGILTNDLVEENQENREEVSDENQEKSEKELPIEAVLKNHEMDKNK